MKKQKGITLIALIITIIILLILAMVSIKLIINDGIIGKAENAVDKYSASEEDEQQKLSELEREMAKASGETVKVDFDKIKNDVLANKEMYLAKAAEAGQNTTSNKDIGIGTDGNIVNLDLWNYRVEDDNAIRIYGNGSGSSAYSGPIKDGKITGTVPQHILSEDHPNQILDVKYLSIPAWYDNIYQDFGMYGSGFLVNAELTSIEIPSTVTDIGQFAFGCPSGSCKNLTSITIPNSVSTIVGKGYESFYGCTNLKEIKIDNTEGAISGAPWGATNAKITYLR